MNPGRSLASKRIRVKSPSAVLGLALIEVSGAAYFAVRLVVHAPNESIRRVVAGSALVILFASLAVRSLRFGVHPTSKGVKIVYPFWTMSLHWETIRCFGLGKSRPEDLREKAYVDLVSGKRKWIASIGSYPREKAQAAIQELNDLRHGAQLESG